MNCGKLIGGLFALALAIPSLVFAQQLDAVHGTRGTPSYGTIVEMSRTQVAIDTPQGKKIFPVNEIRKVVYSGDPRELKSARDAIRNGQIETAQSDLEKISLDGILRKEILQDIEFYKAQCDGRLALTGGGDKIVAVREMRSFIENRDNTNSHHYYEGVELLGDLAVALASYDNGIKYYGMLGEAPWPEYKMRAMVLEAGAMVANQQFTDALKKYQEVLALSSDDILAREQKLLAAVGEAVCLAETGKPDEGIKNLLTIIAENNSQEKNLLFARAYNALGTCYLRADKPKDGLLAFLHVHLLFNQNADAHAESLYYLSKLWRTVGNSARALDAQSLLENRYSGSPWVDKK